MKRLFAKYIVLFLAAGFLVNPAWADMDYHCLSACVNSGKTSAACMKQCTYGQTQQPLPAHRADQSSPSTHNQFVAPVPSQGILYNPPAANTASSKDYDCITQCQQNGFQYQLCDERCVNNPNSPSSLSTTNPSSLINGQPPANKMTGQ